MKDYIVIVKLEEKEYAKSYDDIKPDKYLKTLKWKNSSGYPIREWTNDPELAIHWHDERQAKQAACLLQREVPWPLRVEHYIEKPKEPKYTVLKTLGEIMQHKGEPLLFGYWDAALPDYAWVSRPIDVKSPLSEKSDRDPDAEVDGLVIDTDNDEFVVMYNNGGHCKRNGKNYRFIQSYKNTYGCKWFNGQLFCRTLTPQEKKVYQKINRRKITFNPGPPCELYLDEDDNIVDNPWRL